MTIFRLFLVMTVQYWL